MKNNIIPDNMVNKTEKIATTMDVEKAIVSISRAVIKMDKEQLRAYDEIPLISKREGDE